MLNNNAWIDIDVTVHSAINAANTFSDEMSNQMAAKLTKEILDELNIVWTDGTIWTIANTFIPPSCRSKNNLISILSFLSESTLAPEPVKIETYDEPHSIRIYFPKNVGVYFTINWESTYSVITVYEKTAIHIQTKCAGKFLEHINIKGQDAHQKISKYFDEDLI